MGRNFYDFAVGHSHPPLTEEQKGILDFGKKWFTNIGSRENAILEQFGYGSTTYFRKLNDLRSHPEAVAYAPDVIRRANNVVEQNQRRERGE